MLLTTYTNAGALWSAHRMRHSPALERGAGDLRAVTRLPRGMSPFQSSRAAAPASQQRDAVEFALTPSEQLPPWPVDAFEFNAVTAHGGHDVRLAWDAIFSSSDSATADASGNESATSTLMGAGAVPDTTSPLLNTASRTTPKLSLVTLDTIRQLKTVEETAEAQAALRGGGWVCTGCWSIVRADCSDNTSSGASDSTGLSSFPRTICPACRTLRHDARIIDTADDSQKEAFVRMTIAAEVDSYPIGHVVVTRNRTTRWRCGACREVNSLQIGPTATRRWTPPPRHLWYRWCLGGGHTATPNSSARVFGPENCYNPNSTQLTCLQCHSPLHGGRVTTVSATPSWWCACGVVNTMTAYSCLRCRLPRALECPEKLRALLRSAASPKWDFRSCTNWMCDSCCGVNTASYQVVAESSLPPFSDAACPDHTKRGRRLWMRHGDAACRHCGAPWHHHVLQEGNSWRCACHALNSRADAFCTSCGLPALDGVDSGVPAAHLAHLHDSAARYDAADL
ncbi:hypothetical protein CGC20_22415 [Leishmania donovani]|uniref:RanBP2-type domain-containing protein n=1 Tax=Leishmania donovani TaxID=5661 RepID=A0A504Y8W9_LEIDO|nr:hypothetical protein CGC20_22415 [Leishmania donovani]